MIRRIIIITFASLLLLSTPVFSQQYEVSDGTLLVAASDVTCYPSESCSSGQFLSCPIPGHHHPIGTPCPILGHSLGRDLGHGLSRRLGAQLDDPMTPMPMLATVPMPVGPPPSGFLGGVFMPQQYRQAPPMLATYNYNHNYNYPQPLPVVNAAEQGRAPSYGHPQSLPASAAGQSHVPSYGHPQSLPANANAVEQGHTPNYGYSQAYGTPLGYNPVIPEQRIVYVPYAMPPPINVERLAKALPRPPALRRILGDAYMYEYPEMPMRTYTTRGPRDFFATNPPSIGY